MRHPAPDHAPTASTAATREGDEAPARPRRRGRKPVARPALVRALSLDFAGAAPGAGGGAAPERAGATKQPDPFEKYYSAHGVLTPPYGDASYETILFRYDNSDVLQAAVDAFVTNVCAFGVQIVPASQAVASGDEEAFAAEKQRLTAWLDHASSIGSLTAVRKRVRRDFELFGDGYAELLRGPKGELAGVEHMPAWVTRKTRYDPKLVPCRAWTRGPDGAFAERVVWRRVRRYAMLVEGEVRWFKEYGDPRPIRVDNGQEDPAAPPEMLANEVLNFCRYEPGSAYGKPRWRGAAADVKGRTDAATVNADIFSQKGIPPMAILVQGAQFDDAVVDRIAAHFRGIKGRDSFHAPLIIEATSASYADASDPAGVTRPGAPPKIEFKDLTKAAQSDAQFLKYREDCKASVSLACRLPAIYLGQTGEYNFATAKASRTVAEEQVFQPERADEDDLLNVTVAPELGARLAKFATKAPPLLDEETLLKVIEVGVDSGALTVNNVADLLEPILNLELSSPAAWRKAPAVLLKKLAEKGVLPREVAAELGDVVSVAGPAGGGAGPGDGGGGDGGDTLPDGPPLMGGGGGATNAPTDGTGGTGGTDAGTGDGAESDGEG